MPRRNIVAGLLVLASVVLLTPVPAQAITTSFCEATFGTGAGGDIKSIGPAFGDCSVSNGFSFQANAGSQAIASAGILRASASSSTNSLAGAAAFLTATANARFSDQFTVSSLPTGASATLRFGLGITGRLSSAMAGAAPGFTASATADFDFRANLTANNVASVVEAHDCVRADGTTISVCNLAAPPIGSSAVVSRILVVQVTASNGDIATLDMSLRANAAAVASAPGSVAEANSDMIDTAMWLGLMSATVDGLPYDGPITLTSDSGFNYLLSAAPPVGVPEPASIALLLSGLGVVGLTRRRRA